MIVRASSLLLGSLLVSLVAGCEASLTTTNGNTGGTAGTAGSGGTSAGTGGTAGTAGTAGSGGTACTAGEAGQGGEAGTGQAGEAGQAGTGQAGEAGTGQAGTGVAGEAGQAGTGQAGTGQAGTGQAGTGQAGTGQAGFCPFPPCEGTGGSAGSGQAGSGPINCNSKAGDDIDKDGFTNPTDCNDCDPAVNPGALDIFNTDEFGNPLPDAQQVDEDCSGTANLTPKPECDAGLALAEKDATKGANAIDICQTTTAASKTWGILSAEYVQLDGKPLPSTTAADNGHGIMPGFGTNVTTQYGQNLLVLSSGTARTPGQAGFENLQSGGSKGYNTGNPTGFPISSPSCSDESGPLKDSIALKVRLRAPTNAKSISFKFKFYTIEFPNFICSSYNDVFIAVMRDKNGKFIPGANPETGNIAFDKQGNYLSVNAGFLDVCKPGTVASNDQTYACESGESELAGTGFETHAGTSWLQTTAPVVPGEEFELLFGISDAQDGIYNSSVLLDSFQWSADPGKVDTGRACEKGGTGTCASCLNENIIACCQPQLAACQADTAPKGCNSIQQCLSICAGNTVCQQSCYNNGSPTGQAKYNDYANCVFGPPGDPDNLGACGVVCK